MSETSSLFSYPPCPSGCQFKVVKRGYYSRFGVRTQRYQCQSCRKSFCEHVHSDWYQEKKPYLRRHIFLDLSGGKTLRRIAVHLQVSRTTVHRKFVKIGALCKRLHQLDQQQQALVPAIQFDDLETFCHSKCKPLSVSLAVEPKTRRILGLAVSQMPAKGRLVHLARKKYGARPDERAQGRQKLLNDLKALVTDDVTVLSDMNPHYGPDIKKHFPQSVHQTTKGRRGCVVGQGELKGGGWDPLFSLNHTCAMLRANMSRLFRRTWNTTKLKERLEAHLWIYALYHNRYVIEHPSL